jgi:hypothetical protein
VPVMRFLIDDVEHKVVDAFGIRDAKTYSRGPCLQFIVGVRLVMDGWNNRRHESPDLCEAKVQHWNKRGWNILQCP